MTPLVVGLSSRLSAHACALERVRQNGRRPVGGHGRGHGDDGARRCGGWHHDYTNGIALNKITRIVRKLGRETGALAFAEPVTHVYNPLDYAWPVHRAYLETYAAALPREVLLIGMNPGPWGMGQTGVPFGDAVSVRGWLKLNGKIESPPIEHPKVRVAGFDIHRREVSGERLWTWAAERFGTAECFFERFMVLNYCPLCFLEDSGRNRTPDKLYRSERDALYAICDAALRACVEAMEPRFVIGIGKFAEARIRKVVSDLDVVVGSVVHPSPASPIANRGWAPLMDTGLSKLGITP